MNPATQLIARLRGRLRRFGQMRPPAAVLRHPHATTREWAASAGAPFWEIHPTEEVVLRAPAHDFGYNRITRGRERELYPPCFIAAIPGGRIWQRPFSFNLVFASDGRPLRDLVFRRYNFDAMIEEIIREKEPLPRARHFSGTTLDLTCLGDGWNYSHWMFDCLPKLAWREHLPPDLRIDRVLINARAPFVLETLDESGWRGDAVLSLDEAGPHLSFDTLLATSPITSAYHPRRVLDDLLRLVPGRNRQFISSRLYVSRADAPSRRVRNEPEVVAFLQRFGFEPFVSTKMSVVEQAAHFSSARWIVGAHGAGLANIVFCWPGTKLLEFFPDGYESINYWALSSIIGIDYACLGFPGLNTPPKHADYDVDLTRLEAALRAMGLAE
ncbi:MAG TPA: glycosyltransferase family 61 protein [Opitutaceae bacterium]|nr:glycosyltransferase family 61 protein [Opitutaceae bacterium]